METRGEYRGVRWSVERMHGMHYYAVVDAIGLGVASWYATLPELQAAVDAAIEREGEDVRLAEPA